MSHFARAIANPFSPSARGVKLPLGSHTSSYSASAVLRTDGSLDATGKGQIFFCPSAMSDINQLWYNTGDVTGIFNSGFTLGVAGQQQGLTAVSCDQLPFNADSHFSYNGDLETPYINLPGVRSRVVSAGIKVSFAGATLTDGGVAYCIVEPQHENLDGYGVANMLSKYTSTKVQRLALRGELDLTVWPVTTDSKDFGIPYDNIYVNRGNGFHVDTDSNILVGALAPIPQYNSTTPAAPNTTPNWDPIQQAKNLQKVLYPLCRGDGGVAIVPIAAFTFSTDINGVITYVGNQPETSQSGMFSRNGNSMTVHMYNPASNEWLNFDPRGYLIQLVQSSQTTTTYMWAVAPPAFAGILINAGTAMANQPYHIEYVVHVEYTGVAIQGRQEVNPPDVHGMAVLASADHAREMSGQHEHGSLGEFMQHALHVGFSKTNQSVAHSIAAGIAPEGTGGIAAKGVDYLFSLGRKRFRH